MQFNLKRRNPYYADGIFTVKATECVLAYLYWADETGPLKNWTAFGVVPLNASNASGGMIYGGHRIIPEEASHVFVRAIGENKMSEELFPLEMDNKGNNNEKVLFKATILSDLHITNKVGTLNRALETAKGSNCLLLPGDLTNDGMDEQFAILYERINTLLPDMPVFQINGNHDLMSGRTDYDEITYNKIGIVDIIGINATCKWETAMPITDEQLSKADELMNASDAQYHIVMLHAQLINNMPVRNDHVSRYLNCDGKFQHLIDSHSNVIVVSGHTHLSPSLNSGIVLQDMATNNIFINSGSIRPTELGHEGLLAPKDWVDGNNVELTLTENMIEIKMKQINQGKYISRGFYRFFMGEQNEDKS